MEEQATPAIHAAIGGIFNDDQSFGVMYEMAATLPHTLSEQMDVESAVETLHRLYCIIWPASRCESEAGAHPG